MVNLRINWTLSTGAVRNRTYLVAVKCLLIYLVYHSFPKMSPGKPELVREKCAVPNKFGLPDPGTFYIGKLIS